MAKMSNIRVWIDFYKDIVAKTVSNKSQVLFGLFLKRDILKIRLNFGYEFNLSRKRIIKLGIVRDALDYGIKFSLDNDILTMSAFPTSSFSVNVKKHTLEEILNLISLYHECVGAGLSLVSNEDLDEKSKKYSIIYDANERILEVKNGDRFYVNSIIPGILSETYISEIHKRGIDNFQSLKILDVGANFGDSSIYFAKRGGSVWAVEPVKNNYAALRRNISINNMSNIQTYNLAIGPVGKLSMNTKGQDLDGSASGFYLTGNDSFEEVSSMPVASFIDNFIGENVDFLKMDCKGCERFLTLTDLKKVTKYLHIEFDPYSSEEEIQQLIDLIHEAGFEGPILNHNIDAGIGKSRSYGTLYGTRIPDNNSSILEVKAHQIKK